MAGDPQPLILASTSPYRRELLARLGLPFDTQAAAIDETALDGEAPEALVERLSRAKAEAVAATQPGAIVIGSDQIAVRDGQILGKPGSAEAAIAQLQAASGKSVIFLTGLAVCDPTGVWYHCDQTEVVFRYLKTAEIERYVEKERPLDCAGSFKSEAGGIALFEAIRSEDPSALIGLPLIALASRLRALGCPCP